jgi:catechol 2,3-dioxygenase-like lactoylglutathione lyase family enzyme
MQFHHVGISVSSLEQSIAFYRDIMEMDLIAAPFPLSGEEVEAVTALNNLKVQVCVLTKGNLMLEVFEFENPAPKPQDPRYSVANHGITHFGVSVEDIDATWSKLTERGVQFHSSVRQFPSGVRAAYGRDPDGNVFELLEMPKRG